MGLSSSICQQRSITSWQRRSISGLPRWTLAKSRLCSLVPVTFELAAPPPKPINMPGPPSTISASPGNISPFSIHSLRIFPIPPASMMGLWYPQRWLSWCISKTRKYPVRFGRPNSLLNAAAPIGPSIIMLRAEAIRSGFDDCISQDAASSDNKRFDTENPARPAFVRAPRPTAASSRISPPAPVAAPGNGAIAVG